MDVEFLHLREKPWAATRPADLVQVRTMLKAEELAMLRYLTAHYYTGVGSIIDAGCFLGGSTIALSAGLRESGRGGLVHAYDQFIASSYAATAYKKLGLIEGKSFRHLYDEQISPYGDLICTYEGDLTRQSIPAGPIEILFIDVAKTIALSDHIILTMFPRLLPGRSVIIQQDYLFNYLPWIHITMERLAAHFSLLCHTDVNSVVFGCIKEVTAEDARDATWGAIPGSRRVELMDQAINKWTGAQRKYLENAKASYPLTGGS